MLPSEFYVFLSSVNAFGILMGIASNLVIFGNMLTIFIFLTHEHGRWTSFHLLVPTVLVNVL